jgi:hypothetical protein
MSRAADGVVLAVVIVLIVGVWFGRNGLGPGSSSVVALQVEPGDTVIATGMVLAYTDQPVLLCVRPTVVDTSSSGHRLMCSAPSIRVLGIDPKTIPGARIVGDGIVVDEASLTGIWTGSVLMADGALAAPRDVLQPPTLICGSPALGSTPEGPMTLETEGILTRLQSEIASNPDTYAGEWAAEVDGVTTVIVGTVTDRSAVEKKLRAFFPYPLCVVLADYSQTALNAAAATFARADLGWTAYVATDSNRVIVNVPVVDAGAAALLSKTSSILVEPLVLPRNSS